MVNERNVEALRGVLAEISAAQIPGAVGLMDWYAKQLSARGVLVPDALTDQEVEWVRWRQGDKTRVSLKRIAMGES